MTYITANSPQQQTMGFHKLRSYLQLTKERDFRVGHIPAEQRLEMISRRMAAMGAKTGLNLFDHLRENLPLDILDHHSYNDQRTDAGRDPAFIFAASGIGRFPNVAGIFRHPDFRIAGLYRAGLQQLVWDL